ncbi:MAG: MBOAT family protein [Bacteroidetes bacterium]|nr:MBOAT family protein [Bacteroidota bacterium]
MLFNIDFSKILQLFTYQEGDPLLFSTSFFIFFFFTLLLFYRIFAYKKNLRIFTLIIFSLFFYYKAVGGYFLILIIMTIVNYYSGQILGSLKEGISKRRFLFVLTIVANLGVLGYFKYTNFFIQIINNIGSGNIDALDIFLPIGISFYTFKGLSYIIDIYIGTFQPVKSFRDFSLYMFFFADLLIGPIDRASKLLPQIQREINVPKENIGRGTYLIMSGLFKKIVIADFIGLNFVDRVFGDPTRFTGVENLLASYAYTLQIYCDFSGYTDMAIGVALLLGFNIMDNFNAPFKATSIGDFWRRWHISLSSWLLDYLFAPLQMKLRNLRMYGNAIALFITFFAIGFWHGSNWTFILFGSLHGLYMVVSIFLKKPKTQLFKKLKLSDTKLLKFSQGVITFHLVVFAFIFFRAFSIESGWDVVSQIFTFFQAGVFMQFVNAYPMIIILMVIGYVLHFLPEAWEKWTENFVVKMPVVVQALLLTAIILLVVQFKFAGLQPNIYFQF